MSREMGDYVRRGRSRRDCQPDENDIQSQRSLRRLRDCYYPPRDRRSSVGGGGNLHAQTKRNSSKATLSMRTLSDVVGVTVSGEIFLVLFAYLSVSRTSRGCFYGSN